MLLLKVGEPAAFLGVEVVNVKAVGRRTFEDGVLGALVAIFHGIGADAKFRKKQPHAGADGFNVRQSAQSVSVFNGQLFAGTQLLAGTAKLKNIKTKDPD